MLPETFLRRDLLLEDEGADPKREAGAIELAGTWESCRNLGAAPCEL